MPDFLTTGSPPMIGRALTMSEWLDYVADYNFGTIPPTRVVLHHTYKPNIADWRGLATMRGMQTYYRSLGWSSAPHIYVGPDAPRNIWLFTPMSRIGIHAGTGNAGKVNGKIWYSIGVEMVGFYDRIKPSGAVWQGTKAVLGALSRRLGIAPRELISFHRDYTALKSCPGWAVTKDWVHGEVEHWLAATAAQTPVQGTRYRVHTVAILRARPNRIAPVARRLARFAELTIVGETRGELADGSDVWLETNDGLYVHSRAVYKV